MADRPQLKVTAHDVEDDDPFAELTRIMGFDPRVPAAAAKPRPVPAPQPVVQAPRLEPTHLADDFSLDLERELMGEFGLAVEEPVQAPRAMEPDPAAVPAGWFNRRHDPVAPEPAAWREPAAPRFQPYPAEAAHEDEFGRVSADEDDSARYDDRSGYARDDRAATYQEEPAEVYAEEDAPAAGAGEGEYYEAEEGTHYAPAAGYGQASETYAASEEADHAAPEVYAASPEQREADYYELSAADHAAPVATAPAYVDYAEPAAPTYDEQEEADVQAAVAASLEEEFAIETDWSDEPDPVATLIPAAAPAPLQASAAPDAQDLAADFDAAMAEVDMDFRTVQSPAHAERAAPPPVPVAPAPLATASSEAMAAPEPEQASDLEDELNALLGKMRSAANSPVVAEAQPAYRRREPVDVVAAMAASRARVEPAYGERLSRPGADNPFEEILSDPEERRQPRREPVAVHAAEPAEPTPEQIEKDPINSLAQMAARLRAANRGAGWPAPAAAPVEAAPAAPAASRPASSRAENAAAPVVPDIETVDVEEAPVALADDLDLPEVSYEEERAATSAYDDLDAEFSDLLGDVGKVNRAPEPVVPAIGAGSFAAAAAPSAARMESAPVRGHASGGAATAADLLGRGVEARGSARPLAGGEAGQGYHPDELAGSRQAVPDPDFELDLSYDPALEDEIALPGYAAEPQEQPRRRGMLVAAVVGGVAVIGAIGAFALSFGSGSSSDVPVLVRADETPIKVKPENPGGITVPNQDNKVYDSVAGAETAVDPSQEKLVTTTEEPVSIAPGDAASDGELPLNPDSEMDGQDATAEAAVPGMDANPAPKSEERIEQATADDTEGAPTEVAAVAPRKVRTLVVKPDGSLVPSGEPEAEAPADTAATATDAAGSLEEQPAGADATPMEDPVVSVEAPGAETTTGAVAPAAETPAAAPETAAPADTTASTPAIAPLAPARPAEQPVDIVGEVKPDKVAAIDPAAAVPAGSWSVQIASQPTAESAQSTWKDLSRRYASVIGDRQPSIVKAEIAGKGTFWRVRIPAGSRNEAVSLCESYKSAGGNCFVSR